MNIQFENLLLNYHNSRAIHYIEKRVKGSKNKLKVSCPNVIYEYNQYMDSVDLSKQMKVSYEIGRRINFLFYLEVFFDFLDISAVNSKVLL